MADSVVRIITRLNIGGPSIQAAMLTSHLEAHGFRTHLIHGRLGAGEGDMSYLLNAARGDVIYLPELQRPVAPLTDVIAFRRLYKILCDVRPLVVHTHMAKAGALGRAAAALYNRTVGRHRPARIVHTYHGHVLEGYFSPTKTSAFVRAERALAHVTDRLIAISPRIRDELVTAYRIGRREQYQVVPLGFDLTPFADTTEDARGRARRALGVATLTPTVTTVGRLTAIKQHELFLAAAKRIATTIPSARFLIVGDGERRAELEALTREWQLQDNVAFLGWRRDLATIYAASDVFLLTSRNEGTPVALIEAMAAGVPGVSTDVGGVRDVITDDRVGTVVSTASDAALAHAVMQLLTDRARRNAIGMLGRAQVLERFGLDRLVSDIAALYRTLI